MVPLQSSELEIFISTFEVKAHTGIMYNVHILNGSRVFAVLKFNFDLGGHMFNKNEMKAPHKNLVYDLFSFEFDYSTEPKFP